MQLCWLARVACPLLWYTWGTQGPTLSSRNSRRGWIMPWLVMVQEPLFSRTDLVQDPEFSRPDLDIQDTVLNLVLFQVQGVNLIRSVQYICNNLLLSFLGKLTNLASHEEETLETKMLSLLIYWFVCLYPIDLRLLNHQAQFFVGPYMIPVIVGC